MVFSAHRQCLHKHLPTLMTVYDKCVDKALCTRYRDIMHKLFANIIYNVSISNATAILNQKSYDLQVQSSYNISIYILKYICGTTGYVVLK